MRRSAFALLIGVSKQMLSKYERDGAVVVSGAEVDAEASLENLAGRLDEDKRQAALGRLTGEPRSPTPRPGVKTSGPTARQEKDAVDRDLKLLEYGLKAGDLVLASEVEDAAARAVAEMRETFANARRDLAAEICATFGLPPDKAGPLARALAAGFERALGRFSEVMAALGVPHVRPDAAGAQETVMEATL